MARHNETGKWGEDLAADYLAANGYAIAERNWRAGHNEIDIVAYKGSRIIFVEVKTRSNDEDDPLEAIDRNKSLRLIKAAIAYVNTFDIDHEIQFDIIGINGSPSSYRIEHIPDAFESPLRTY
ncbi:MAG: YraN family protein [Muribaculaceae bacterium]|nr:YraN family protein [Muribaculaceae bacterium]